MSVLLRVLSNIAKSASVQSKGLQIPKNVNYFHSLTQKQEVTSAFLAPVNTSLVQSCGFKVKGFLRKRCKDCYFVRRQERLYVICNTHRRHKQMSMVKDEKNTWILSHATQGKVRPW